MTQVKITDTRPGVSKYQMVELEKITFSEFVGGAVVNAAMLGDVIRTSHEYVRERPVFTLTGVEKQNGYNWRIKWTRTYTLMED